MQNKIKTYLLIAAVIFVWGLVGFRMYSALEGGEENVAVLVSTPDFKKVTGKENMVYELTALDRDPFLGIVYKPKPSKKNLKRVVNNEISWPSITYTGYMENSGGSTIYFITVNGNKNLYKKGVELDSVLLIKGDSDKVVVRYNRLSKTFNLQR